MAMISNSAAKGRGGSACDLPTLNATKKEKLTIIVPFWGNVGFFWGGS